MSGRSAAKMAPAAEDPLPGMVFGRLVDHTFDVGAGVPAFRHAGSLGTDAVNDRGCNPA